MVNSIQRFKWALYAMLTVALASYVIYLDRNGELIYRTSSKQAVRLKLTEFYTKIPIGTSLEELRSHYLISEPELSKLSIQGLSIDKFFRLVAPQELPGFTTSWLVDFYTDGQKVVGKQIRSAEGNFVSCTAPADEGKVEMKARTDVACSNY